MKQRIYLIFPFLWAISILFQLSSCLFLPLNLLQNPPTTIGIIESLILASSILLLLLPHSVYLLNLVSILIIIDTILNAPHIPNHRLLTTFVALSILISSFKNLKTLSLRRILKEIAPTIRFLVFTLYFYAVFHKLNSDFLFSEASCAKSLYRDIRSALNILPENSLILKLTPWITISIEGILPFLLFFSRTRNLAILVAIIFHFFLSIDPLTNYIDFSSTTFPLFVFFLSDDFFSKTKENLNSFLQILIQKNILRFLSIFCFLIIFYFLFNSLENSYIPSLFYSSTFFWFLYTLTLVTYFSFTMNGKWQINRIANFKIIPSSLPQRILIILFFLNGTLPYLGLKTRSSFDMYSNLRVEGGISNHLIVKKPLDLLGYTSTLVKIIDSSDNFLIEEYKNKNLVLTYFEFWRYLSTHPEISVSYEINNKQYVLKTIIEDPTLTTPPNLLLQKLLWYRPVDENIPARCQW